MPTVLPLFEDGNNLSPLAGAPIVGGQAVSVSADKTVSPSAAGAPVVGVASQDATTGAIVRIIRDGVWPMIAATAVAAGDLLVAAANGQVSTAATNTTANIFAVCWKGAAAGGTCYAAMRIS